MEQKYGKKKEGSLERTREGVGGKPLSVELEPQFLQDLFVTFQFGEKSSAIISVAGLKHPDTVFRRSIGHPFFDEEVAYAIGGEEIPDDHFSLYLAISIAFLRKGYIHPAVQVPA
jgi:hypothetical protein